MAGFLAGGREEAILQSTIREWASSGCEALPCGLSVWRYASAISGAEPSALPDHQSRKACVTLLREKGGLEEYARELMLSLHWQEVADPVRGDVAVVEMPKMGLTCAVCLGAMWMAKGDGFVLTLPAPHRAAWRFIGCRKPLPPRLSPPLA